MDSAVAEHTAAQDESWRETLDIADLEVVAEAPDLRVVRLTLGPDDCVQWHWHSNIADHFVCVKGAIRVETRAPKTVHDLSPGEETVVPAKTAHLVTNTTDGMSQFLIIQGVGEYDFNDVGSHGN
jgi:quercetin dioxygenase-like cupin family protein